MTQQEKEMLFRELDKEYEKKFGEGISTMMIPHARLDDLIREMKKCIATNKPFEYPEYPKDAII